MVPRGAALAVGLLLCASGSACGGDETRDGSPPSSAGERAAAPATTANSRRTPKVNSSSGVATTRPRSGQTRPSQGHLTAHQRRQARRLAKQFRRETAKAARGVVTDSGVIP